MSNVPELAVEQRRAALAKAAVLRRERARIKADMKAGEATFAEALDIPCMGRVRVSQAIAAMPGWGPKKAAALMESLGISERRRLQGLGAGKRAALVKILDGRR